MPDAGYPGGTTLEQEALVACRPQARAYLADSTAKLRLFVLVPLLSSWTTGDHDARCAVIDPAGARTGDIRQDR